ncbi:MAG TPA: DUF1080 domain-containing protein [Planctomycetales bacterium]|nr:DUF1080 domain-containing protein [Planctomycetales bacterium]
MFRRLFPLSLIAALLALSPARPADKEKDLPEGFTPLFDGKDLAGWEVLDGKKDAWAVENGMIVTKSGGGGWLLTDKEYGDFEVRVDFKMSEGGNSGVALRAPLKGNVSYSGMEIQLLDDVWHKKNYKDLKPVQLTGAIYGVVAPSKDALKPVGEWNTINITAKGRQITILLNGVKRVDANLDDYKEAAEKDHPGLKREKGHLGLQSHSNRVEFRNVYVKEL